MFIFDLITVVPGPLADLFEWMRLAMTCTTGPRFDELNPLFDSAMSVCTAR